MAALHEDMLNPASPTANIRGNIFTVEAVGSADNNTFAPVRRTTPSSSLSTTNHGSRRTHPAASPPESGKTAPVRSPISGQQRDEMRLLQIAANSHGTTAAVVSVEQSSEIQRSKQKFWPWCRDRRKQQPLPVLQPDTIEQGMAHLDRTTISSYPPNTWAREIVTIGSSDPLLQTIFQAWQWKPKSRQQQASSTHRVPIKHTIVTIQRSIYSITARWLSTLRTVEADFLVIDVTSAYNVMLG
ncbi:hypothetical protein ACLOJK_019786 [Asimina triloba]